MLSFAEMTVLNSVYNKKKNQMFLLNMAFISFVKWKICIFHFKSHIQQKHLNILYICHILYGILF